MTIKLPVFVFVYVGCTLGSAVGTVCLVLAGLFHKYCLDTVWMDEVKIELFGKKHRS